MHCANGITESVSSLSGCHHLASRVRFLTCCGWYLSFCGWIMFHCADMPRFIRTCTRRWNGVVSTFGRLSVMLLWTFVYKIWSWCVFISLGYVLGRGLTGSCDNSVFNFLRSYKLFSEVAAPLWRFWFLHNLLNTYWMCPFGYSHPSVCEAASHWGSYLCSPNDWWRWAVFHVLIGHFCIFFG